MRKCARRCRRQVCARRRAGEEAKLTARDVAVALFVVLIGAAIVAGVAESEIRADAADAQQRLAVAAEGFLGRTVRAQLSDAICVLCPVRSSVKVC